MIRYTYIYITKNLKKVTITNEIFFVNVYQNSGLNHIYSCDALLGGATRRFVDVASEAGGRRLVFGTSVFIVRDGG